ncbi:alpha-N-acetylgalactosaminide alpha-2,6-sialyltransferase 2-like isoform 1-T3 [Clarias gariepinus]|uniref:alpha-N-acetylgalactosaminide alpha-2,6-sialyltransferase 2-like n=1 Tax=Clarias gariepinus TaxID=13013 RepID=UPI00234D6DAD|nr:alpha-N-acetylgalactosaminide alpha-2,6-sialyltransferase 2-like [Clarias gariepinus]XP_053367694.1 alpha-N-acetylgalactosaminide alpha-2,6-sialyltransferase 2-like [Clarias gariepinus]XP_053367695.1 alpha-N-acetylgalactosaminide alpha-2,6-sialyltransferase 2-like [Clarias gariepinus]
MILLRHRKRLVLCILLLFLVAGIYLLIIDHGLQSRLQDFWHLWSSALFNVGKIKDQLNQVINISNSQVEPVKPDALSELEFLGDEYAADNNTIQTSCPRSIRKNMLETDFADRYLPSVPVLQWAKHFSKVEYERLSRYRGAHGWGSVNIDVLNESLAILNTSANQLMFDDWEKRKNQSKCIRCAVVGNGGILSGSKKGREIDQNDYVFRTNGAIIQGFEEDVGSRTSFYTFSTNTLRNSLRSYGRAGYKRTPQEMETRYIFLPDHDRDYILMRAASLHLPIPKGKDRSSKPPTYFGSDVTVEKFKMYHPDFVRYIRNRFLHSGRLKSRHKNIYRPSTGAVMLLAALHTCDEVNAYGFMTPDFSKYSDHYYDKIPRRVRFFANHDLRLELKLWQNLHKAGLINLYMRT